MFVTKQVMCLMTLKMDVFFSLSFISRPNESVLWKHYKRNEKDKGHTVLACHARAHLRLQQKK